MEPKSKDDIFAFKIVGDNIDKNVKPSRERAEIKTQSLHYFHSYVVKDRIPVTDLSDDPSQKKPDPQEFLPSEEDIKSIKNEMRILLTR